MKKCVIRIFSIAIAIVMLTCLCSATSYIYFTHDREPNFEITNLDKLHYGNVNSPTWLDRIHEDGCFITSYAMILRNIGKTTVGSETDIRNGTTGSLQADPFTVTFANTDFAEISTVGSKYVSSYSSDPVVTNINTITENFNASSFEVSFSGMTEQQIAENLAFYINAYPQGVGIVLNNSTQGKHLIVGVDETYTETFGSSASLLSGNIAPMIPISADEPDFESVECLASYRYRNGLVSENLASTDSTTSSTYESYFIVCDPINYATQPGNCQEFQVTWSGDAYDLVDIEKLIIIY